MSPVAGVIARPPAASVMPPVVDAAGGVEVPPQSPGGGVLTPPGEEVRAERVVVVGLLFRYTGFTRHDREDGQVLKKS